MPSVVGMSRRRPRAALSEAGFRVNVDDADSLTPKGQVFSQSPGGGAVTPLGTLVTIYVSTGEPAAGHGPAGRRSAGSDAKLALHHSGWSVNIVKVDTDDPSSSATSSRRIPRHTRPRWSRSSITILVGVGAGGGDGGGGGAATAAAGRRRDG